MQFNEEKIISPESVAGITGHPYGKNEPGHRCYNSHKGWLKMDHRCKYETQNY